MTLLLYCNGQSIGAWADATTLKNAVKSFKAASDFSLEFISDTGVYGGPLPVTLSPGRVVYYVDYDSVTPANSKVLFGGIIKDVSGTDKADNVKGSFSVDCTVPQQELKRIMEYIAFSPDAITGYPNDRSRILRLGVLISSLLTTWDFTTGISATASVTYPSPPIGEALTEYEFKSIEDIINDIATDPGRPGDTGYPVPMRRWWVSARLATPATPSAGIRFVLNYRAPADIVDNTTPLKDRWDDPLTPEPGTVLYESGAVWRVDASSMIRQIHVAGPKTDPVLCAWQNATNVTRGHGFITKTSGTDGAWDAGAVSKQRFKGGDWEALATVQEAYLCHHQFEYDDGPTIPEANTGQQTVNWYQDLVGNTMGLRGHHAAPHWPVGTALCTWQCFGATVILRSHFSTNEQGMGLVFRLTDQDNYWRVENTGGDYSLIKREAGSESTEGTLGVTPADGDEIKVFALGSQIQVYQNDVLQLQVTGETFNEHETMHGLYYDTAASGSSPTGRFYDFQCTTFFSDDAFGLTTLTSVDSWVDISYGFVKNNNGTLSMNEGGVVVATDDYSYNDKLKVAHTQYFDYGTASIQSMVTWEKLPFGATEWETLHSRTSGVVTLDESHPWYVAFAGSDLGSTLNNISLRKQYANLFHADPAVYGVYSGEWPANGLYQSDELDTYIKRQAHADAIFLQYASPRTSLDCTIRPSNGVNPFNVGERITVTNHQALWFDDGFSDDRKHLILTSFQRIENAHKLSRPSFKLTLADRDLEIDLSGQRHLLKPGTRTRKPDSRGVPSQTADPTVFEWPDPTGDENFGDYTEVQLARIDAGAYANAQIPVQRIAPDASAVQIDRGQLVPGAQYVLRTRNGFNTGIASDWTESSAFVAPAPAPYDRPYTPGVWLGDGTTVIVAGANAIIELPESGEIIKWSIASYDNSGVDTGVTGTPFPADAVVDVQYCDADTWYASDVAGLMSIAGTDLPTLTAQTSNESTRLTGWTTSVKAGGRMRFGLRGTPTPTAKALLCAVLIRRSNPS